MCIHLFCILLYTIYVNTNYKADKVLVAQDKLWNEIQYGLLHSEKFL